MLGAGLTQAGIADRVKKSRPFINQVTKNLESLGLIQRRIPPYFYDLSNEAKELLSGAARLDEYTPARVHNFKRKYKIISKTGEPYTHKEVRDKETFKLISVPDPRSHFEKSWDMRGGERSKFWYSEDAGVPSVTIDYHFKTLVIYIDKGQTTLARDVKEAEALGWAAIRKARDQFVREQHGFGVDFVVEEIGQPIGKLHAGFAMQDKDPVIKEVLENDGKVGYADYWVDKSVEKEVGPGYCEAETAQQENMTRLGRGIQFIETVQPEMFKELEKLGPLTSEVHTVVAHLQSGQAVRNEVNQLIMMFGKVLEQQSQILEALSQNGISVKKPEKGQQRLVI